MINDHVEKSLLEKGRFYEPPKQIISSSMPYAIVEFLNGKDFERKASQALHLSTVDEDGWPREAMLSAGEMLTLDASEVAMLPYQSSNTWRNLARDGRLTLTLLLDHGLCVMHLRGTAKKQEGQYRYFIAVVEDIASVALCRCRFRPHLPAARSDRGARALVKTDRMLRGLKSENG